MSPTLVVLTAEFPFGDKSETFLEIELEVIARRFERILLLPSHRVPGRRAVPAGVETVEMGWLAEPDAAARRAALLDRRAAGAFASAARAGDGLRYVRHARTYLDRLARNVLKARELERWVRREGLGGALFYDYWFENSTLALAMLRRAGTVRTAVARAHGFDVYDERWSEGRVPFRRYKAGGLDRLYAVSEHGRAYLADRMPGRADRVRLARLGVRRAGRINPGTPADGIPTVLTCGSLIRSKRIERVPGVLARLERPLQWVHLGDGPERDRVEAAARGLPDRVAWRLEGHVPNARVLELLASEPVDLLLSLSLSEGLPVTMMEAVSFGVPVVGLAVQGVPEIVTDVTGVLLPPEAGSDRLARGVSDALDRDWDRRRIRAFHRAHFDARTNYDRFADDLLALADRPAPAG